MGTFDAEGNYTPRKVTERDVSFADSINETIVELKEGKLVTGTVVRITRDEVLVEIGYKTEGVILNRELSIRHDADPNTIVKLGDKIETLILTLEDKEGRLLLSKKRAQYERAWGDIEAIKNADGTVEGLVIEAVKGGLIVDIGLRGFLPASLVELRRVRDLAPYLGQRITAKILELDRQRNNVVLSRRAWLEQTQSEVRNTFLKQLQKGQIRTGVVSSIVNFGAFVRVEEGIEGLVHVSEMSWTRRINNPAEVMKKGDDVEAIVLDVDVDQQRISLGVKQTQTDPWSEIDRKYRIGDLVNGKVSKIANFGAFIELSDEIDGLVHVSQLAEQRVENVKDVVKVGQHPLGLGATSV